MAGYPCQKNSRLNPDRFSADPADSAEADVLLSILQLLKMLRPKVFVLENVGGLRAVRTPDKEGTMLDWLNAKLSDILRDSDYTWEHFDMQAFRLLLV